MKTTDFSCKLKDKILEIDNNKGFKWDRVLFLIQNLLSNKSLKDVIKINLVKTTEKKLFFHVVICEGLNSFLKSPFISEETFNGLASNSSDNVNCIIIPTGIGARYGGYAGDANPVAKLLSLKCEYLITHPNVVNGAVVSDLPLNIVYLEGYLLDQFLSGQVLISPKKRNKIGVIFDGGINEKRLAYEINVLNGLRAFYGCEIIGYSISEVPIIVRPLVNSMGFSSGEVLNINSLLDCAYKLKESGASALAVCCSIPDLELNELYIGGCGVDPIGGVESYISRIISSATGLVSAHAPVLAEGDEVNYNLISPVSASEYIAKTFLPSVISGLRFAPEIITPESKTRKLPLENLSEKQDNTVKSFSSIKSLIVPYNGFGSPGVFFSQQVLKNVVLIKENITCLDVNPAHLNIDFKVVNKYSDLIDENLLYESGIDATVLERPVLKIARIN